MSDSAVDPLERERTVNGVLRRLCVQLTERLPAEACVVSRVIGLLLVEIVDYAPDGRTLSLGRGYLLPDYPLTQEVIDCGEPRAVWSGDPSADPNETALLRELALDSLLMLPLEVDGRCWGLVEVYRTDPDRFDEQSGDDAREIVARAGEALERVQRRDAHAA